MNVSELTTTNPLPDLITKEELILVLPDNQKKLVTDEVIDTINNITSDPIFEEHLRDNIISYTGVLTQGRFKLSDYINAVTYVSFKIMGLSNKDSYAKTFPDRYTDLLARGLGEKAISSYVSAYNSGKLVNLIYEQSIIPTWVINRSIYQDAINTQADIMTDTSNSPFVRSTAANSLLTHLAKPKEAAELNINLTNGGEKNAIDTLNDAINKLAEMQSLSIEKGHLTARSIAEEDIIEGEVVQNVTK